MARKSNEPADGPLEAAALSPVEAPRTQSEALLASRLPAASPDVDDIAALAAQIAERFPTAQRELFVRRVLDAAREAAGLRASDAAAPSIPTVAPEFYRDRADKVENPEQFILRVYGDPAENGLTLPNLRRLDFKLYELWAFHKAKHKTRIHIPTQREATDLKAKRLGLDPKAASVDQLALDPEILEAMRVRATLTSRIHRKQRMVAKSLPKSELSAAVPTIGGDSNHPSEGPPSKSPGRSKHWKRGQWRGHARRNKQQT